MKHVWFIILAGIVALRMSGQGKVTGIYLSAADYTTHKLTPVEKHHHVKLHDVFYKRYIEVTGHDTTLTFEKDSIFGFIDENNGVFRFHKKEIYPVIYRGAVMLYKIQPMETKNGTPDPIYYFSKTGSSPVMKLTKSNLAKEFSDNPKFLELMNSHFTEDHDLHRYDEKNEWYVLDHILTLSKN